MLLTLLFTSALDPLIIAILSLDSLLRRQPNNEIASKIEQNLAKHLAQAFKGLVLDGGPPDGPVTANHSQQFRGRRCSSPSGFAGKNCLASALSSFSPDLAVRSLPCRMTSVFVAAQRFPSVDHECACEVLVSATRCVASFSTWCTCRSRGRVGVGDAFCL